MSYMRKLKREIMVNTSERILKKNHARSNKKTKKRALQLLKFAGQ